MNAPLADPASSRRLLTTKLHPPRSRSDVVERPRLTERLSGSHRPALTLVSAPAGFGKSTLLGEWCARTTAADRACAWLSLDTNDDDPVRFATYLVAALTDAGVGNEAAHLLETGEPLAAVVTAVVNDVAHAGDDVTMFLDDYHSIGVAAVHDAVAVLVEQAPPGFHLVIATRADPPLPLARWRARGDLLEVRAADLRFRHDEVTAYLDGALDRPLAAADTAILGERTEGWIAALQLATLSLRDRDDTASFVRGFAGDDRFVLDYLVDEVLDHQTAPVRRFLLTTSVLDRLSGSLCDELTGDSDGQRMLEQLDRANLFVVPLDDRRQWYRYHHLFADVLRVRLLDESPGEAADLHRRASVWFDRHGDAGEAIRHAFAGDDDGRAAELVERAAPEMRRTRQEATLRRWLETLPTTLYADRPVLGIALVGARMASGDPSGVGPLLDEAERWLDATTGADDATRPIVFDLDEFDALPAQIAVYRAALALLDGDIAATRRHATRAVELARPDDHLRRGAASALIGLAAWTSGDLETAAGAYTDSIEHLRLGGFVADVLGCSLAAGDIAIARGRLAEAGRTYEWALRLAAEHGAVRGPGDMRVALADLALERGHLDVAAEQLRLADDLGERAGLPQFAYRFRAATARLALARGETERAIEAMEGAARRYFTDFSPPVRPVDAELARCHLAAGDTSAAMEWVREQGLAIDDQVSYLGEYEHVTLAMVLFATGHGTADLVEMLGRWGDAARAGGRWSAVIEIETLLAVVYDSIGDRPAAAEALERALQLAAPESRACAVLGVHPRVVDLLRSIGGESASATFARRLADLASARAQPPSQSARAGARLVDGLSERELDVLRLLRSELSGPEIARELHVSVNTLRTHTKSIYTKLGATSRREAVRLAAEYGY